MTNTWGSYSWWGPAPFAAFGFLGAFGLILLAILVVVMIALKGYALWYAAKRDEKWWFVIMLIVNTAGILELCYLIFVVKKWHTGLKGGTISGNETKPDSNGSQAA